MKLKPKFGATALIFSLAFLLPYTFAVYSVIGDLYLSNGDLSWRTSPPGSLFPIPHGSGMLQALSNPTPLDKVLYFNLIRNNALLGIDLALTLLLLWLLFITWRPASSLKGIGRQIFKMT